MFEPVAFHCATEVKNIFKLHIFFSDGFSVKSGPTTAKR